MEGATKEETEKIKAAVEKAGTKVELKSNDTPEVAREDQMLDRWTEDGAERVLQLDSAAAEFRRLMERVLNKGECWDFEIDLHNRFIVKLDVSPATPCIMATASLVGGAKAAELKKLGWTVYPGNRDLAKAAYAAAILTAGVSLAPLLNRRVRDYLFGISASRSWMVTSPKDAVIDVAVANLIVVVRRVAPEAKPIVARRQ